MKEFGFIMPQACFYEIFTKILVEHAIFYSNDNNFAASRNMSLFSNDDKGIICIS